MNVNDMLFAAQLGCHVSISANQAQPELIGQILLAGAPHAALVTIRDAAQLSTNDMEMVAHQGLGRITFEL